MTRPSRGPAFDHDILLLDAQGLSFTVIGLQLGVTRSVVSGRLKRIEAETPGTILKRAQGVNPAGKTQDYARQAAPYTHKPRPPNRQSIVMRPHEYKNPTKAEMYEDLRKAVENTK
jgi:hypothetical protein